jgi:glucokinase
MSNHVLAIDLGGSNVRVALADLSGQMVAQSTAPTLRGDAPAVVAQLVHSSRELALGAGVDWSQIGAMAVGVPGAVGRRGGELRLASNLPPLAGFDVAAALEADLGIPVALENDVNMATLAEQRHGLGAGVPDFVFIAIGTGVGMGIVASGQLQHGATGAAGEIAFLPLGVDPFERGNQTHGPLEEAVGGAGVVRRYAERSGGRSQPPVLGALDVYERSAAGDLHARAVLEEQARATALAVMSAQSTLDPALVVFGGGIGSRPDFVARVREHVARLTARPPAIEVSSFDDRGGLIGAAELARDLVRGRVDGATTPAGAGAAAAGAAAARCCRGQLTDPCSSTS